MLNTRPPAAPETLARLRAAYPELPGEYLAFLARNDGAEGDLGVAPGWFQIWPAEQAIGLTDDYGLPEFLPGYFCLGSNGGGELLVVRLERDAAGQAISMVPAVGLDEAALVEVAGSFAALEAAMGRRLDGD
jgi:hypothetical protein